MTPNRKDGTLVLKEQDPFRKEEEPAADNLSAAGIHERLQVHPDASGRGIWRGDWAEGKSAAEVLR